MAKPCSTAKVCVCVRYPRYYTIIKYLFKSLLRTASCCAALFNCTSGWFWILEAKTSLPQGSRKLPLLTGMRDNWITCMCQIFLINHTGAAGMYGLVFSRTISWLECQTFDPKYSHLLWNTLEQKTESWPAPGVLLIRDCVLWLFWWNAYVCVLGGKEDISVTLSWCYDWGVLKCLGKTIIAFLLFSIVLLHMAP